MHQINLSDTLYQDAQRRAFEAGFTSVDEYVADVLTHELHDKMLNLDQFFTPSRLAEIDQSVADVRAGKVMTLDQARDKLSQSREAWLRDHPNAR